MGGGGRREWDGMGRRESGEEEGRERGRGEGGEGKGEDGERTQNIGNEYAAFSNTYMSHSLAPSHPHRERLQRRSG